MPFVWNVTNVGKLMIHALAVGGGAGLAAMGAVAINFAGANLPVTYAAAIGAGVGDVVRLLTLELRKLDPMPDEPTGPQPA